MFDMQSLLLVCLISLGMVLTPGPNMIYLISRSLVQGKKAGLISLCGVALGFVFYLCSAAFGLTTLFVAVPYAYDVVRYLGVIYLLWLAWNSLKPNGTSVFEVRKLKKDNYRKLFFMGFMTNLLNPKIAILYMSLLPQFIKPELGNVFLQSLVFGAIQVVISLSVNAMIALSAAYIAQFFSNNPFWLKMQRYFMGTVLGMLALRMAFEKRT